MQTSIIEEVEDLYCTDEMNDDGDYIWILDKINIYFKLDFLTKIYQIWHMTKCKACECLYCD